MTRVLAALAALAAVATLAALALPVAGCKKLNAAYCDAERPCGIGFACDLVSRECRADTEVPADMSMPDLYSGCAPACSGITPICMMPTCLSCTVQADPEAACLLLSASTPHCATDGSCVGCRDGADCTDPNNAMCDPTTHACRGCATDSECPSLVCDLTPGSATRGRCVDKSNVMYVDGAAAMNGDGLTAATPLQKIQDALNKAIQTNVNRTFVRVATGTYNEAVSTSTTAHPLFIVGANGTIIKPNGGDALSVAAGASLTVRNVIASSNGNGVNCQQANSKFTAYHSQFVDNLQIGVFGDNLCTLTIDGCWVNNNAAGITLGGSFVIINSIITNNRGTGGFTQMAAGAKQIFANNTVADNPSVSATGGVTCVTGGPLVVNSILYGNTKAGGGIGETNCSVSYVATDDPTLAAMSPNVDLRTQAPGFKPAGVPLTADAFHLLPTSPCKNAGTMSSNVPDHDFDFEPRPDTASMKVDIGADELQQ